MKFLKKVWKWIRREDMSPDTPPVEDEPVPEDEEIPTEVEGEPDA